jgi:IS1 family transposase
MWSFVAKKQKNCDPNDPADDHKGDWWDFVAYDAERRLVVAVVPGARSIENAEEIVQEVHDRTEGREDVLLTSDELPAYETAIGHVYGVPEDPRPAGSPGRPPIESRRRVPADLKYATVHKEREKGRVVAILTAVVLGTWQAVAGALERSSASRTINTSFLERHHLTDRHHNARKSRKTYRFSKDWRMHEAMTYFTKYSYNFCWPVRTLREQTDDGRYRQRTPAMAAGLADHVWSLERLTIPCSCNHNVRTNSQHLSLSPPGAPRRSPPAASRPSAPPAIAGSP